MKKNVLIVGAGIVGLATAYKLSVLRDDIKITVIDKEKEHSRHQTGNNSGVIHSGLYYKPGSLKATNCITGYHELIRFADEFGIAYDLCGKIVVATSQDEVPQLEMLFERGQQNGLQNLKLLSGDELKEHEPHVAGVKGMFVPQTGIINYKEVCNKLADYLIEKGHLIEYGAKVKSIARKGNTVTTVTTSKDYLSDLIITCAGLYSDKIAKMIHGEVNFKIIPFRGEYYKLEEDKEHLVKNLIYPVPDPNFPFLGVHFTRMIKGGVEAGPNAVLAYAREGYDKTTISPSELTETLLWPGFQKVAGKYWKTGLGEFYRSYSKSAFTKALQKLIPDVQSSDLRQGGAGVRAQACDKEGGLIDDFLIMENDWSVSVCNAPSPAATSSLSIGNTIAEKVIRHLE